MNNIIFVNKEQYNEWIDQLNESYRNLKWQFLGGNPNKFPLMVVFQIKFGIEVSSTGKCKHSNDQIEFCIINENLNYDRRRKEKDIGII
jgi:hypothetical protein